MRQAEDTLYICCLASLAACSSAVRPDPGLVGSDGEAGRDGGCAATQTCKTPPAVVALRGYDPDLPADDIADVASRLASAQVIGLGESAHASEGFIGIKIRLTQQLIEAHGVRAVVWESSRVPAEKLNDYVQTCSGDAGEAVKNLYEIWSDVLTRDFAVWLCQWNEAHPEDRVQVFGSDVQDPESDYVELQSFLRKEHPKQANQLLKGIDSCDKNMSGAGPSHERCQEGISAIRRQIRGGKGDTGRALIALRSFEAWQDEVHLTGEAESFEARDIGMADVLLAQRELYFPGKKAVLWAHNIHVVKQHQRVKESWVGGPIVTQGTALDRALGEGNYIAVAIVGMEVSLNRNGYRGPVSPSPGATSLEARLQDLEPDTLFLDLRAGNGEVLTSGAAYEMGAPGVEVNVPAQNYGGVIYLQRSPMATLVP